MAAINSPTAMSGHAEPVTKTPAAASSTPPLARTSFREHTHAERMFISSARRRLNSTRHPTLAASASSPTLSGKIQPDGRASIDARGMVGNPRNAVRGLSQGTAYAYRVDAVFEGTRGVGNRADDIRPCNLTFVK